MIKKKSIKAFSLIELSVVILVIGLLTLGITQGSRVMKSARLQSAMALTKSSPVNSTANMALWLDVTDSSTMSASTACSTSGSNYGNVADGYFINKWDDKNSQSTTKINTAVAGNTDCPVYTDKGIGNLPTLRFDGTDDAFQALAAPIATGNKDITIFSVVQRLNTGTFSSYFSQYKDATGNTDNSNTYLALSLHTPSNIYPAVTCGGPGGNCFSEKSGLAPSATKPYVVASVMNNSVLFATHYINGVAYAGNAGMFANWNLGGGFALVGARRDNSVNTGFFNGYISELIVFNRTLKTYEVTAINDYLMKKYSIK